MLDKQAKTSRYLNNSFHVSNNLHKTYNKFPDINPVTIHSNYGLLVHTNRASNLSILPNNTIYQVKKKNLLIQRPVNKEKTCLTDRSYNRNVLHEDLLTYNFTRNEKNKDTLDFTQNGRNKHLFDIQSLYMKDVKHSKTSKSPRENYKTLFLNPSITKNEFCSLRKNQEILKNKMYKEPRNNDEIIEENELCKDFKINVDLSDKNSAYDELEKASKENSLKKKLQRKKFDNQKNKYNFLNKTTDDRFANITKNTFITHTKLQTDSFLIKEKHFYNDYLSKITLLQKKLKFYFLSIHF